MEDISRDKEEEEEKLGEATGGYEERPERRRNYEEYKPNLNEKDYMKRIEDSLSDIFSQKSWNESNRPGVRKANHSKTTTKDVRRFILDKIVSIPDNFDISPRVCEFAKNTVLERDKIDPRSNIYIRYKGKITILFYPRDMNMAAPYDIKNDAQYDLLVEDMNKEIDNYKKILFLGKLLLH